MNGTKYLLDTCFIIRWYEGQQDALSIIEQLNIQFEQCSYSDISHAEIFSWQGLTTDDELVFKLLLFDVERLEVSKQVINKTIQIRKAHKMKLPDALILATAKVNGLQLITLDDKLERIEKIV